MDFDLPDSALAVREGVAAVAARYDHAYWSRCEEEHRFPQEVWQDLCDGGWIGLSTDDIHKTYEELTAKGVEFTEPPTERPYGTDCGLRDPFGNAIRINQPK